MAVCARVMYAGLMMQVPVNCFRGAEKRLARGRWQRTSVAWAMGALLALGMSLVCAAQATAGKKKIGPWAQVSLDSLGFPGVSNLFLSSGSSMLTVHLLDSSHLLVTYSMRTLVPRVPGDPIEHDDRLVAGEVVDLPSGHIVARTEWHMHDYGRYLWKLGNGRFLMRIGERLYTMAPLVNLASGNAFLRTVFSGRAVPPSVVDVSPAGDVLTLETVIQTQEDGKTKVVLGDQDTAQLATSTTLIDFFRIINGREGSAGGDFNVKPAGGVLAPVPLLLPIDGDGYLWARPVGSADWAVAFDGFGGKTVELGKVVSSCRPRLQMTSRSEFVALTCLGSDDHIKLASYGLDGHETWEEVVGDVGTPTFAFAPTAARFAMSHIHVDVVMPTPGSTAAAPVPTQEVRVYQNASGEQLLRAECRPVFKTEENFDLSPDGMTAAVVRDGVIAVYKLPPLSKTDLEDMAEVEKFAPPAATGNVELTRLTTPVKAEMAAESLTAEKEAAAAALLKAATAPSGPRKPPSLLKPGEKPEFGSANEPQN